MSLLGLLPIIQLVCGFSSCRAITSRYVAGSFSTISTAEKNGATPERATLSACSAFPVEIKPAPPVRQTFVMEVINGNKKTETKFDTTPEVK